MGAMSRVNSKRRRKIRERLCEAQNHRCCYCGEDIREGATIEHVNPSAHGGKSNWENLVAACRPCNERRDTMNPTKFYKKIIAERERRQDQGVAA